MTSAIRCITCNVWVVPFGERDLGDMVLEHLRTVHAQPADFHPCEAHRLHPSVLTPEPVA